MNQQLLAVSERGPILVPIDLTENSTEALLFASRLASYSQMPLTLLHVVHETPGKPLIYRRHTAKDRSLPLKDIARQVMDEYLGRLRDVHAWLTPLDDAERILVSGLPSRRIPEVASAIKATLIVMAKGHNSRLYRLFNGSISSQVASRSQIPVTFVYPNQGEQDYQPQAATPIAAGETVIPRDVRV